MRELVRTNDAVLISFVQALLRGEGIETLLLDQNMSVLEGSLGMLQQRVMIVDELYEEAVRVLREAGVDGEIRSLAGET